MSCVRSILIVAASVLAAFGFAYRAAPVNAKAPVTTRTVNESTITDYCPGFDFDVLVDQVVKETMIRFSDRQLTIVHDDETITNSLTGESLSGTWNWQITFLPGEQFSYAGVEMRFTVPGEGVVALDSGRAIYDWDTGDIIFDKGPSNWPDLCRLFD